MDTTISPSPTNPPPPPPIRPNRGRQRLAASAVGLALLAFGSGVVGWNLSRAASSTAVTTRAVMPGALRTVPQASAALGLQQIANRVDPALVDINTEFLNGGGSGQAAGTGIILTAGGEVLTNNHVVEGATRIRVAIAGRPTPFTAQVLGVDPTSDVALIQVLGVSNLPVATLADSSRLRVGQHVVAIGNALGRGGVPNATEGAITALNQSITAGGSGTPEQLSGMIESDAPISPGDSGGALVNSAGQVVGMITAGQTSGRRQTTSRLGYAIPASSALSIVNEIRAGHASAEILLGEVGYIGVSVTDLSSGAAASLGLNAGSGVAVTAVNAGSPAENAGLAAGSVITAVAGTAVTSTQSLGAALHSHKPGERIELTWHDRAGTHSATVTLTTGPAV